MVLNFINGHGASQSVQTDRHCIGQDIPQFVPTNRTPLSTLYRQTHTGQDAPRSVQTDRHWAGRSSVCTDRHWTGCPSVCADRQTLGRTPLGLCRPRNETPSARGGGTASRGLALFPLPSFLRAPALHRYLFPALLVEGGPCWGARAARVD
ncbi:unnamed protein product [Natator depressus]